MSELGLVAALVLIAVNSILLFVILLRRSTRSGAEAAQLLHDQLRAGREEQGRAARELREEISGGLTITTDSIVKALGEIGNSQRAQLESFAKQLQGLTDSSRESSENLRRTVETQLKNLREGNEKRLEEMRKTVDEKLQNTLEKRLGESFKLVSERLEAVQRGLGEMQNLATGVGDLKRVLTNVKARGTWGEVQLGAILEQILTPDQYDRNVKTKAGSDDAVEYAVHLPGRDDDGHVWLPIDSKFPQEDYLRLMDAAEKADQEALKSATDAIVRSVKESAQTIRDKYLDPPHTTDFAMLFLPTEGLYAEVLRQPGVVEELQQVYRIVVAGPTTLSAILNSLRLGFRTLAIEKRSSEVWQVLAAVKMEFGRFGEVLTRVKKQLATASNTIEQTGVRTRAMERKLRQVEELPAADAQGILGLDTPDALEDDEEEGEPEPEESEA